MEVRAEPTSRHVLETGAGNGGPPEWPPAEQLEQGTLEELNERFRSVLENSLDAAYRRDLRTDTYDYLSPVISQVLGISAENMKTLTVEGLVERIHPEDREGVRRAVEEGMRCHRGEVEYRVLGDNGEYRWAADHFTVQLDEFGRPRYRTGIVRDANRRKRAELAAQAALESAELERQRLSAVLAALPAGVAITDAGGRITHCNEAYVRIWGSPPVATGVCDYWKFTGRWADSGATVLPQEWAMARTLHTGEVVTGDIVEIDRFDGSGTATIINAAAPIRDADGEIVGGVLAEVDITAQKQAEAALREATRVAEAASLAKSRFLAVMSHELRTPLTGVIGFADLLETEVFGSLNHRQREALARIKSSSWHLVGIIDEILTLSRVEANKEEVRWLDTDVAAIARDVADIIEPQTVIRGLTLQRIDADAPLLITTDPGKVRQILVNLLGNAAKFTERGTITLRLHRDDPATLRIQVADTGPGIPASEHERIFEPFTQLDSSHTRSGAGAGLGLAICRRLARLVGGDVLLQSEPGSGSTFTLLLPRLHSAP